MNRSRLVSLGVAALCMTAIGVSATTLDGTVSTKPDDAIDLNFKSLPIGQDSAEDIDREIKANQQRSADGQSAQSADTDESGETEANKDVDRPGAESQASDPRDSGPKEQSSQSQQGPGAGPKPPEESLLERLLDLLRDLLPAILALLGVAAVAVFAYRYRARLLALAAVPFGLAAHEAETQTSSVQPWDNVDFGDDVERAWYAMVQHVGIDRAWAKTPDECRRQAVAAGLDPAAVETLTETFREARYAENGPTPDHERRARESLDRLGLGRRSV